ISLEGLLVHPLFNVDEAIMLVFFNDNNLDV
ncbi:uncharacterized protein METZ01_LOCUS84736, partial [marine metagenome]